MKPEAFSSTVLFSLLTYWVQITIGMSHSIILDYWSVCNFASVSYAVQDWYYM